MSTKTYQSSVNTPAFFVPNHGQYPQEVLFSASAKHTRFYFMKSRIIRAMGFAGDEADALQGIALSMGFADANPGLSVQGAGPYEGKINYFIGNDSDEWKSNIPTYGELKYNEVWEGISLAIRHTEKGIKLDWHVAPGGNPDAIRLTCEGADCLSVSDDGSLLLAHRYGEVCEEVPVAYQIIDGQHVVVPCGYRIDGALSYGFWLGEGYDPARELIIDPLLPYSTYLGGNGEDNGNAIAVDAEGCAYITGYTKSTNFPVTPGAFQTTPSNIPSFITKFSADGSQLIYSTYLGGTDGLAYSNAIAVDSTGHAYVTGRVDATDFPITPGAFQTSKVSSTESFVTKLSPDGASLVYSTYLGGSKSDLALTILVDTNNLAYVGGYTSSADFPITPGAFQTTLAGSSNGFLSKFSVDGSALIYSTFLGSSGETRIYSVAVDAAGSIYATGYATAQNFPVTAGAFQTTFMGGRDAYVTKFSPDGSSLVYSTFAGGALNDVGRGICIDEQGNAYVTGQTLSEDFPVTAGVAQSTYSGGSGDAFAFKLSADGSSMVYSTYLGGDGQDIGYGIALASDNRACVTGQTWSSNFPITPESTPTALPGTSAAFFTMVSKDGASFFISSYIGGDNNSSGTCIATGADSTVNIAGNTSSSNFPVTPGALQPTISGGQDAFVYRTVYPTPVVVKYAKASLVIIKR